MRALAFPLLTCCLACVSCRDNPPSIVERAQVTFPTIEETTVPPPTKTTKRPTAKPPSVPTIKHQPPVVQAPKEPRQLPRAKVIEKEKPEPWETLVIKLKADAATSYPDVRVPNGRAKEVHDLVAARTEVERGEHIHAEFAPIKQSQLNLANLTFKSIGEVSAVVTVVRCDPAKSTLIVSVPKGRFDTALFAVRGVETEGIATDQLLRFNGMYEVYATDNYGIYTLHVLREVPVDNTRADRRAMAQVALDAAEVVRDKAKDAHAKAWNKAHLAAIQSAEKEAKEKYLLLPDGQGTIQDRLLSQKAFDEGIKRMVAEAKAKVAEEFVVPERK